MNRSFIGAALLALSLAAVPVHAHNSPSGDLSAASGLSLSVPVAISVAAPSALIVTGASFTVVAIEALAEGTVWVLERASDGARFSVRFGRDAVAGSVVAGTVIVTTVVAAGCVLSAAGEAVAFIPNEIGRALIHDERITR